MELLQLEYFLRVAQVENVTKVAEQMFVAQSSVSRSIARLEEDLGFPLFERRGQRIKLNEQGKVFYKYVERALRQLHDGRLHAREVVQAAGGRIALALPSLRMFSAPLLSFMTENRESVLHQYSTTDPDEIKNLFELNKIDFAVAFRPLDDSDYTWTPLLTEHFYFMTTSSHPLAQRDSVAIREIMHERFVVNKVDADSYFLPLLGKMNYTPILTFSGDDSDIIGAMLHAQLGCSVISSLNYYDVLGKTDLPNRDTLAIIPITDPDIPRELGLITMRHHYLPVLATSFCKMLKAHFAELSEKVDRLWPKPFCEINSPLC